MAYLHRGLVGPFIRIKFYSLTLNFFIKIHVLFREDLMKMNEKHPVSHCSRRWGKITGSVPFFPDVHHLQLMRSILGWDLSSIQVWQTNQQTDTDEDIFFLAERMNQSQCVCRIVIYPLSKLVNPSGRIKIYTVADSNHAKVGLGWGKGMAIMPKVPGILSRGTTFQGAKRFLSPGVSSVSKDPYDHRGPSCHMLSSLTMLMCQRTRNKIRLVFGIRFLNIGIHDHWEMFSITSPTLKFPCTFGRY